MSEKRILDLPEVTEVADDDVVVIDNSTDGVRSILVSNIESGGGGGGPSVVECTRAQYDAMSTADKNNGNAYVVVDDIVYHMSQDYIHGYDIIPLFQGGEWIESDEITITPYLTTLSNNKLHCQGLNAGVIVSAVSMTNLMYSIIVEGTSDNGFGYQAGQCQPTTNLTGVIQNGSNRITYNNQNISSGDFKSIMYAEYNTRGVFFGGYYNVSTTDYYISRILLCKHRIDSSIIYHEYR